VAIETPRGWRIGKDRSSFKIDCVVALAMACYAAVKGQGQGTWNPLSWAWLDGREIGAPPQTAEQAAAARRQEAEDFYQARLRSYLAAHGAFGFGPPWGQI
jgi:hypothetical protein